jgi:hypothetical protein
MKLGLSLIAVVNLYFEEFGRPKVLATAYPSR